MYECISKKYSVAVVLGYRVSKEGEEKKRQRQQLMKQKREFEDRIINSYTSIHTGFVCEKKKQKEIVTTIETKKKAELFGSIRSDD